MTGSASIALDVLLGGIEDEIEDGEGGLGGEPAAGQRLGQNMADF